MSKSTKVEKVLAAAAKTGNRKMARDLRVSVLHGMIKSAQDFGILQNPTAPEINYETREHHLAHRGGTPPKELYGVGLPDYRKVDLTVDKVSRSLSTRYSPDRVGVQARRISDGVYQDPITNKTYDWNEGFTTESGDKFSGGNVSLQTDIMYSE